MEYHNEPTFENQIWQARKLAADKGLEALNNPHAMIGRTCQCGDCFCCAALQVYNKLSTNYQARRANEFAHFIKNLGFKVYMAESGTYGFITDNEEKRVLSFHFDGLQDSLRGNYGPPSTSSGTGWGLAQTPAQLQTKEDVEKALNAYPDYDCGKGWKYMTTVKQHLAAYGSSSKYREL